MEATTNEVANIEQGLVRTGLTVKNAQELLQAYGMPLTRAGELLAEYEQLEVTDESQTELMQKAKDMRLELRDIRLDVKKRHDELKADVLQRANAIDYVERTVRSFIKPAEEYLEQQEKFVQRLKAEKLARLLAERKAELLMYVDDIAPYFAGLGALPEDKYKALLAQLKKAKQDADKAAALEAEKLERERAEAREAKARAEAAEAKAREAEAEAQRLRNEAAAAAKTEADKKAAEEAAAAKAAAAPDKDKLIAAVKALELNVPPLDTEAGLAVYERLAKHLASTTDMYIKQIEKEL